MIPEPGALMAFGFLADHGLEGYQYAWGGHGWLDGSQPLGLLSTSAATRSLASWQDRSRRMSRTTIRP